MTYEDKGTLENLAFGECLPSFRPLLCVSELHLALTPTTGVVTLNDGNLILACKFGIWTERERKGSASRTQGPAQPSFVPWPIGGQRKPRKEARGRTEDRDERLVSGQVARLPGPRDTQRLTENSPFCWQIHSPFVKLAQAVFC